MSVLAESYFDHREQRTKPVPDCAHVGGVWNAETQRCERGSAMRRRTGLGFASPGGGDYFDGSSWDDVFYDYLGMGYDPFDAAYFANGGGSGGNGWWWGNFDESGDYVGGARDPNELWNDLFYWYLSQGYDPLDAATLADAEAGSSIGVKTDLEFGLPNLPSNLPGVIPAPYDPTTIPLPEWFANDPAPRPPLPPLPGACYGETYHPQWDPFACVPYPDDKHPTARKQAQQKGRQQQQQQQKRQQQMQQKCPPGQKPYPYTGKCVPEKCATGTRRNPATGECVKTQQQGELPKCPDPRLVYDLQKKKCVVPGSSSGSSNSWLWLLLIAGGAVAISKRRS